MHSLFGTVAESDQFAILLYDQVMGLMVSFHPFIHSFINFSIVVITLTCIGPWIFMKDMFARMEKRAINLNDLRYFKDMKRDEALRFFSDKWAMAHNCEKNLEDIAEEMVALTKKQGLSVKQATYEIEEMNVLEREILFFLANMKKTMHPDHYATFQSNSK